MARSSDKNLREALIQAYSARAKLFHRRLADADLPGLLRLVCPLGKEKVIWKPEVIGISQEAFRKARNLGIEPHEVFLHPTLIRLNPRLIRYYRNLVAISKKGISQILFSTESYESGARSTLEPEKAQELAETLNRILSSVVETIPDYTLALSHAAIVAEFGAEIQGTWVNAVGKGAAKVVEGIFDEYISEKQLGKHVKRGNFVLSNGWRIVFASEPDVAFFDAENVKQIAIEIKGSLDLAGAQTRYGETKKSFGKQKKENPRCYTVYLASCFTESVVRQIQADGQVSDWFNLTDIVCSNEAKDRFLQRVFHMVNTPPSR